jgi:hypothetical protein
MPDQPENPPFQRGHKRSRSTHITDYYCGSKTTKSTNSTIKAAKTTHNRSSSSTSTHINTVQQTNRNKHLPANRTYFKGNLSIRSTITKQNPNHKNYYNIPNNKYLRPTMSAAKGQGKVTAPHELQEDVDTPQYYFETRTIQLKFGTTEPTIERTTLTVEMRTKNEWPCYTFNAGVLDYADLTTQHQLNIGYRHKSAIILKKTKTEMIYQTSSNYAWKCRKIVWMSGNTTLYNRIKNKASDSQSSGEYDLLPFVGTLKADRTSTEISWTQSTFNSANLADQVVHKIDYLLEGPKNTKYPSTPFYWAPSEHVSIVYDSMSIIPGKENYLDHGIHIDNGWEKGPGLISYDDKRERGGTVKTATAKIRFNKNMFITYIWEPEGVLSGQPLPASKTGNKDQNNLKIDVIHTIFWDE